MKTIFSCGLSLCVLFFFSNLALAEDGPFAFGDLNCSGAANVVDVVLSVNMALGIPMSEDLDANGDGFPDACPLPVTCGEGTVLNATGNSCVGVITQADLDAAFDAGAASVDMTSDNAGICESAGGMWDGSICSSTSCQNGGICSCEGTGFEGAYCEVPPLNPEDNDGDGVPNIDFVKANCEGDDCWVFDCDDNNPLNTSTPELYVGMSPQFFGHCPPVGWAEIYAIPEEMGPVTYGSYEANVVIDVYVDWTTDVNQDGFGYLGDVDGDGYDDDTYPVNLSVLWISFAQDFLSNNVIKLVGVQYEGTTTENADFVPWGSDSDGDGILTNLPSYIAIPPGAYDDNVAVNVAPACSSNALYPDNCAEPVKAIRLFAEVPSFEQAECMQPGEWWFGDWEDAPYLGFYFQWASVGMPEQRYGVKSICSP